MRVSGVLDIVQQLASHNGLDWFQLLATEEVARQFTVLLLVVSCLSKDLPQKPRLDPCCATLSFVCACVVSCVCVCVAGGAWWGFCSVTEQLKTVVFQM